jgi:hypothetical protein
VRGMLFTLGVAAVGGVLFAFSVSYNLASMSRSSSVKAMELERATSQCADAAYNLRRIFEEYSGVGVDETDDGILMREALPSGGEEYAARVAAFHDALEMFQSNVSMTASGTRSFTSDLGVNYTHISGRQVMVTLPAGVVGLALDGNVPGNVSSCNLSSEAGSVEFASSLTGSNGGCERSRNVNLSADLRLDLNGGEITMEIRDRILSLASNGRPVEYALAVRLNESRRKPPALEASVVCAQGAALKRSEVLL